MYRFLLLSIICLLKFDIFSKMILQETIMVASMWYRYPFPHYIIFKIISKKCQNFMKILKSIQLVKRKRFKWLEVDSRNVRRKKIMVLLFVITFIQKIISSRSCMIGFDMSHLVEILYATICFLWQCSSVCGMTFASFLNEL